MKALGEASNGIWHLKSRLTDATSNRIFPMEDPRLSPREKVVCLVSGGIDSPVAAWLMIRRGFEPIFVYFDNYPLSDETTTSRALETIDILKQQITKGPIKTYIVPHGENLAEILRRCPRKLTCVCCRRMMYRIAVELARREGASAIVTGEILGEHASQTSWNLLVENADASGFPVVRPLIGMNKLEVERIGRSIGTFGASTRPASCCTAPPKRPRTHARLDEIAEAEKELETDLMVQRSLAGMAER